MEIVDSLPARPLKTSEIESVDGLAPYSGQPLLDRIYAVLLVSDDVGYALGFDEDQEAWIVIEQADYEADPDADDRIDTAVNEWVEETYGEGYGNTQVEV
jgi:hypothetical protein